MGDKRRVASAELSPSKPQAAWVIACALKFVFYDGKRCISDVHSDIRG